MTRLSALFAVAAAAAIPASAAAQQPAPVKTDQTVVVLASGLKWNPLELAGFAPGVTLAAVQGDPAKEAPYTLRLKFPDGYVFPAHFHPNPENLTVLSGRFLLGHGAAPNDAGLKEYSAGDYLFIPAGMPHFGRVSGETIVQLHGMGPFAVTLAQPDKTK